MSDPADRARAELFDRAYELLTDEGFPFTLPEDRPP
jgi:hypothetical protein